jgi:hypothetical protein
MSIICKTYPNFGQANAAINVAKSTWIPPTLRGKRGGKKSASLVALLGPLRLCSDPYELTNGRYAVIADHPTFTGETIEESQIVRPVTEIAQAAQARGASSGVVSKPGAEQKRKGVG